MSSLQLFAGFNFASEIFGERKKKERNKERKKERMREREGEKERKKEKERVREKNVSHPYSTLVAL